MFELVFSAKINKDILLSINYIKDMLKAARAAENHAAELKKQYNKLKENPLIRPLVRNKYLAAKGLRFIKVKNYILIYKVDEKAKKVFLYRFMYGRRDWLNILTNELSRE
ncbi:toxin ParE [Candidatus Termititenax aidoneus]|uniref:Toxin ParE n=1 Tax=Termititenax aidoneus TaxID=2218524 RepID=A0A388TDT4_TERA1|nr:toxin ParE [Candidatus Termititenax aidoneus]